MTSYKLYYFDLKARAEVIRLALTQAGVEFEDVRCDVSNWPELKESMPLGQLPVLEFDGSKLTQSFAILHFVGRRFGLLGENDIEEGKAFEVFYIAQDIIEFAWKLLYEKDEIRLGEMKKKYTEIDLPRLLGGLDTFLGEKEYFVGSKVTVADLNAFFVVDDMITDAAEFKSLEKVIEKYPRLVAHRERIAKLPNISAYLAKRPSTTY